MKLLRATTLLETPGAAIFPHTLIVDNAAGTEGGLGFVGFYLMAQPSITQVLTWFHALVFEWYLPLYLVTVGWPVAALLADSRQGRISPSYQMYGWPSRV